MEKIIIVKHWTEGVTSSDNTFDVTPCANKEVAKKIFNDLKEEISAYSNITVEKENKVECEFTDNGATCSGYIEIIEMNVLV